MLEKSGSSSSVSIGSLKRSLPRMNLLLPDCLKLVIENPIPPGLLLLIVTWLVYSLLTELELSSFKITAK